MTIQQVGEQLDREHVLHFGNTWSKPDFDITNITKEEFIKTKIFKFQNQYNTYFPDGQRQCYNDKWRSIGDMYLITKFYYPDINFIEYLKIFYKDFKLEKHNTMYVGQFCGSVLKRTFRSTAIAKMACLYDIDTVDEWGKTINDWVREIEEIAD